MNTAQALKSAGFRVASVAAHLRGATSGGRLFWKIRARRREQVRKRQEKLRFPAAESFGLLGSIRRGV